MPTIFSENHADVSRGDELGHKVTENLLTDIELAKMLGCSRSTIWKWAADGILPKPLKIGGMSRWKETEGYDVICRAESERAAA